MRREGHLFEKAVDFQALCAAARRAARGKAGTEGASSFLFGLETEALKLQRELLDGAYRPRPYRTFWVRDPKPRIISAAHFRDRVAHHALCAALEPVFERAAIFDSYACRRNKGVHAALRRAQEFARRFAFFLKLDIRKFYETLDHAVLKARLRRLLKDRRLLELAERVIDHGAPGSAPGKGLPIGNLTSQHFANDYLSPLDHFIKEDLRVPGYLRYMDDQLLFADSKGFLRRCHDAVRSFLAGSLLLGLKDEATVLAPVSEGIPFLGMRVSPSLTRLGGPAKRRLIMRLRLAGRRRTAGSRDDEAVERSIRSVLGHAMAADALGLRRSLFGLMELGSGTQRAPTG